MIRSVSQLIIVSILAIFLFSTCKKMKPAKPAPAKQTEEEKPIVVVPPKKKNMLPVKLTTTNLTIELIYQENTAFITEIRYSSGLKYTITYVDKMPKKLQKFKDNVSILSADYLITNGQISRAARFEVRDKVSTPTEKYYFEYTTAFEIKNIKTHAVSNALISEHNLIYKPDGNLLTSTLTAGSSTNTFSYDTKNAIFRSVMFSQFLKIELVEDFMNQGANNVLSVSNPKLPKEELVYEYTYATDDYPSQMSIKKDGVSRVYKVEYIELK